LAFFQSRVVTVPGRVYKLGWCVRRNLVKVNDVVGIYVSKERPGFFEKYRWGARLLHVKRLLRILVLLLCNGQKSL